MKCSIPRLIVNKVRCSCRCPRLLVVGVEDAVVVHGRKCDRRENSHANDRPEPPGLIPLGLEFCGALADRACDVVGLQDNRQIGPIVDVYPVAAAIAGRPTPRDLTLSREMPLLTSLLHLLLDPVDGLQNLEFT